MLRRTLLLSGAIPFSRALSQGRVWSILPLGDSITECSPQYGCYRRFLAAKLREAGYNFRFMGSKETFGTRHDGYSGQTAEFLAENVKRLYTANPADIVLLHAGHNHSAEENPVPGILSATERIIATIFSINPRATVLLAQVIPSGKLPKYSYIPSLNEGIGTLSRRWESLHQGRVVLVNQARGFDYHTDTIGDLVHPSEQGARKMADKWYAALVPVMMN